MRRILIINGPNLNLIGIREKSIYGEDSLEDINCFIEEQGKQLGIIVHFFQSNCEGSIIDKIHESYDRYDGFIINPGAFTHYSYAIYDSILSVNKIFIEVHLSNIHKREEFRRKSVIGGACVGQITGFGKHSYLLALYALKQIFTEV